MIILDIVFYTFVVVVIIQLFYNLFFLARFAFHKENSIEPQNIPVSVIVCAKNEAQNLKTFIPSILDQDYKNFEVVLINDSSNDNTLDVINDFASKHDIIKVVDVKSTEAFWGNKKYALTLGIKASKHEHLLFTDADCKPTSKDWIKHMTSHFSDKKSIVLGYGAYSKEKNSFLNKLIRYETLVTAINYFSLALTGLPYMGVGRNLAYTKKEFFNANGFIGHIKVRSGDDDLFINQIANSENTNVCFPKESFTVSKAKTSFKDWIFQKRRHVSTAKYYKQKHKIILALLFITNFLFWTLSIILFIFLYKWPIVLSLFLLRLILQSVIFGLSAKKLEEKDLIYLLPFLEIFLIIAHLTIFINNLISKPDHWK